MSKGNRHNGGPQGGQGQPQQRRFSGQEAYERASKKHKEEILCTDHITTMACGEVRKMDGVFRRMVERRVPDRVYEEMRDKLKAVLARFSSDLHKLVPESGGKGRNRNKNRGNGQNNRPQPSGKQGAHSGQNKGGGAQPPKPAAAPAGAAATAGTAAAPVIPLDPKGDSELANKTMQAARAATGEDGKGAKTEKPTRKRAARASA